MKKALVIVLALAAAATTAANADSLEKGNKEIDFAFSYNDLNPDGTADSLKTTTLAGSFGYLLGGGNEVGGRLAYSKQEQGDFNVDATQIGAFYNYNFRAGENLNPYLGAQVSFLSGDLGDVYDNTFGVEAGLKVWPWTNAGFKFGLAFDQYNGADDFEDAKSTTVFGGIGIKF